MSFDRSLFQCSIALNTMGVNLAHLNSNSQYPALKVAPSEIELGTQRQLCSEEIEKSAETAI